MWLSNSLRLVAALAILAALSGTAAAQLYNEKEDVLIDILKSDKPGADKAIACKKLAVSGSAAAVPELAKLLPDEKLSSWSRTALEAIPGPEADEALRKASETLTGRLLVGTINSIGVRRDAKAVEQLSKRLKDKDVAVATAAAIALGKIGNEAATTSLKEALASAPKEVRSAVAEGCILSAEKQLAAGKADAAAALYDEVRKAEVPNQRIIEATRGAILARKADGLPLLIEQLRSPNKSLMNLGLNVAREMAGKEVTEALAKEMESATPERASLMLLAIADRDDKVVPAGVLAAAKTGDKEVRMAAVTVIGKAGDTSSLPVLLDIAADADAELSASAKSALSDLKGEKVDSEIASRLEKAEGKSLAVLIELVGQRRIDATPALVKALDSKDAAIRKAALTALGETISQKQFPVLVAQAVSPKNAADAPVALKALRAAAVRMSDREAAAGEVAAGMSKASVATKVSLLETLGEMQGKKALDTLVAAVRSSDDDLRNKGSELLGEWMSVDAGPQLLDLAKTAPNAKYQLRALRGYIRLARQFPMPNEDRAEMCANALAAATRDDERQLVIAVLERYPSLDTLKVAIKAASIASVKEDAARATMIIAQKVGDKAPDARQLISKIGIEPIKLEITKATFGAGNKQKDVTDIIKKQATDLPLIVLPSAKYVTAFGGDPAPNTPKQLKIEYKINGKSGEATFAEEAVIMLPTK
jgi:HEAT repeat protein